MWPRRTIGVVTMLGLTSVFQWSCDNSNARDQYYGTDAGSGFEAPLDGLGGAMGGATGSAGAGGAGGSTGVGGDSTTGTGGSADDGGATTPDDAGDEVGALDVGAGGARVATAAPRMQKGLLRG